MRGCDSVIKFVNAAEPHIDCIGISKYGQRRSLLKVISFGADTDQAYLLVITADSLPTA